MKGLLRNEVCNSLCFAYFNDYFYGKVFALIVTFLLFIVLMIGTYLDKPKKKSKVLSSNDI